MHALIFLMEGRILGHTVIYKVHSPLDMKILQKMKKMNKETPNGGNLVK